MNSKIETNLKNARGNLLLVVGLSAVNVILLLANSEISFLFSSVLPMFFIELGQMLSLELGNSMFFIAGISLAVVDIALYLICYLLSKKYKAFILVALVLFAVDTLFLLWELTLGIDFSVLLDIAFHAWVIYYLVIGVKAWSDFKKGIINEEIESSDTEPSQE